MHYCKIFVVNISCWIACHCLCELGINVDFFSTMIEILLPPTVSVGARRLKVVAVNTICNLWNTCQKQYLSYIGSYIVHLLFWEGAVIHVPEKGHENNYQHRHTLCPRKSCEIVIFCAELVCQNDATIPAVRCDISRQDNSSDNWDSVLKFYAHSTLKDAYSVSFYHTAEAPSWSFLHMINTHQYTMLFFSHTSISMDLIGIFRLANPLSLKICPIRYF